MQQIILGAENKKLHFAEDKQIFCVVGDNNSYFLKFDIDEPKTAMFAVFKKGLNEQAVVLDLDGKVNVPFWCLKKGYFEVGLTSDGYATTPIMIEVKASIIDESGQPTEDVPPGIAEQLIALVNQYIQGGGGSGGSIITDYDEESGILMLKLTGYITVYENGILTIRKA